MNPVRAAITFPVPVLTPADIFHTAAAIPAADHGTEYVPTFLTGQQSSVAVLCTIVDCWTCLLLQPRLDLLPDYFFNDDRIGILVAKPVRFADGSRFTAEIFSAMIDQHAGIGFLCQHVFHTSIRPKKLAVTGLVRLLADIAEPFRPDLRRRFASETVEPAGDLFLPAALQIQNIDKLYRLRCFLLHQNLIRISIFPVSERRRDHQPIFLLLPVASADLLSDVLGMVLNMLTIRQRAKRFQPATGQALTVCWKTRTLNWSWNILT